MDISAKLLIINGETPSIRIEADDNLLPYIGTRIKGGTLYITQDRWIEPSQDIYIRVGAPFTTGLETSGYSDVTIESIEGPRLLLDVGVGKASVHGTVNRLQVRTKTGEIDATDLETGYADIAISSHGLVKIGEVEELITDIYEQGVVVYGGSPEIRSQRNSLEGSNLIKASDYQEPEEENVTYIAFTLVNNSRKRAMLRVEGPRNRSFGYGFNVRAKGRRAENWPAGTRLFLESGLRGNRLILTITEDMQGQSVTLFKDEEN